jgi:hypothetical protein
MLLLLLLLLHLLLCCAGEPLAAMIARRKDYLRWMSGQV